MKKTGFLRSLSFKVGLALLLAQSVIMTITGVIYVTRFSEEIDKRFERQAEIPGELMRQGLLTLDAMNDRPTMYNLVGDDLLNGRVVDTRSRVLFSLNPEEAGQSLSALSQGDPAIFNPDQREPLTTREASGNYISVTPILGVDQQTVRFWVYVNVSNQEASREKNRIATLFLIFSLTTLAATFIIIYLFFNRTIFTRIAASLGTLARVEAGDLTARVPVSSGQDELAALQRGINSMVARLQDLIGTLENRVLERTQQLEEARQQAEAASNAKSTFLSNMSHELRTPLNMVIGYTSSMLDMPQMYENVPLPEMYRADIRLIRDNGRHLLSLINDILDLSKIEAGKLELQLQPLNLTETFNGVIATSIGLLHDKPVQIRADYPETLPLVFGDPLRVRQILLNLMSNAVKFTETGSVTLAAQVEGNYLRIAVTDTGIGIPENALATIFDRFQQVQQNTAIQGTGLGLDISQRLAQMHGSHIDIQSQVGQGSTFAFKLPIMQVTAATPVPQNIQADITIFAPRETPLNLATVLVIEDDAETRQLLRRVLEGEQYVVVDTHDGAEATLLATALLPEAILLDLQLPTLDGLTVLQTLRAEAETRHIPVILITGGLTPTLDNDPLVTIVQKPFEPVTILQTLRHLLNQQATQ